MAGVSAFAGRRPVAAGRRPGRRADAGGDRHPRADGDGAARRPRAAGRPLRLRRRRPSASPSSGPTGCCRRARIRPSRRSSPAAWRRSPSPARRTTAQLAAVLALMVGVMLVVAGVVRMGWVADLLSTPVLTGFLAGIAVHIVLSQAPAALGLPEESGDVYHRLASARPARSAHQRGRRRHRARRLGADLRRGAAEPAHSRRADRAGRRDRSPRRRWGSPVTACRCSARCRRPAALRPAAAGPREPACRWWAWPASSRLVVMVQTAATTRSFSAGDADPDVDRDYHRRRRRQPARRPLRRLPGQRQPAAHRRGVARPAAASQVGGPGGGGRGAAAAAFGGRLLADTPTAALAGVLFFVAQRIFQLRDFIHLIRRTPAEFALAALTAAADRAAADPDRRRHRHLPVAGPRRLHHHPGAADPVRAGGGHHGLVAADAGPARRVPRRRWWWRLPGAAVVPQRLRLPPRRRDGHRRRARRAAAAGAGGQQHRRDRLHRRRGAHRGDPQGAQRGRGVRDRAAGVGRAPPRSWSASACWTCWGRDHLFHSVQEAIAALAPGAAGGRPQVQAPTSPAHSAIWAGASVPGPPGLRMASPRAAASALASLACGAPCVGVQRGLSGDQLGAQLAEPAGGDRRRRQRQALTGPDQRQVLSASPGDAQPPRRPAGRRPRRPGRGPAAWPGPRPAAPVRRTR